MYLFGEKKKFIGDNEHVSESITKIKYDFVSGTLSNWYGKRMFIKLYTNIMTMC